MKSIAIMQPVYLPWLGYFEQMATCDEFVFLDDVQFTVRDWRNRNKIRTKDGWMWITVPIKRAKLAQTLQETEINYQTNWPTKQLNSLKTNYSPSPYFPEIFQIITSIFDQRPKRLIDMTIPLVISLAEYINIKTSISYSSEIPKLKKDKNNRIIEICNSKNSRLFYTGPSAKTYIDLEHFSDEGIKVIFQNYKHPEYKQCFKNFVSHMSIVDLLMNYGPYSREILLSSESTIKFHSQNN